MREGGRKGMREGGGRERKDRREGNKKTSVERGFRQFF